MKTGWWFAHIALDQRNERFRTSVGVAAKDTSAGSQIKSGREGRRVLS